MALFDETPLNRIVREQSLGQTDPFLRNYTEGLAGPAFQRGVKQSLGLGADYLGSVAGSVGQRDMADDLYGYADQKMVEAGRMVAGPQTTDDVKDLGSAIDFGVNKAFESLPVSATALGAAALTRGRGLPTRIAASAAPILPVTAGETSYSMRKDPDSTATESERALTSTATGAVGAALEVLPEIGVIGGLVKQVGVKPAKTMAEAVLKGVGTTSKTIAGEAVTEAAQDAVSRTGQAQFNESMGVNPLTDEEARKSYIESAAAGAAGGTLFGAPAGVATTLQSMPNLSTPEIPSSDNLRQFIGDMLTPRAERIEPSEIPANMNEAVAAEMQRETTLTERARALKDRLMRRGDLTPEEQASIQDDVDLDPDAQQAVVDLHYKKIIDDTIEQSLARMRGDGKESRIAPEIPMEEVDTIVKEAGIAEEAANPRVRRWLAAYRPQLETGDLSAQVIDDALSIFGERGYSVLRVLAGNNEATQAIIDEDQARNGQLDDFLFQALKPEYRDSILPQQMRQLGNLIRNAVQQGDGNLDEILSTSFQNPAEVLRGLDTLERDINVGVAQKQSFDEDGSESEVGDTQSIQDVQKRYFGDTRRNRRLKTGGIGESRSGKFVHTMPWPMSKDEFANVVEVAKNAKGLAPDSDIVEVPATIVFRELGIDPADVAKEMGTSVEALRNMVYLQGSEAKPTLSMKSFVRMLKKSTIEQLNSEPRNPSAGSYLAVRQAGNSHRGALDVRRMVSEATYGDRTPQALLQAFADGVSSAMEQGYKLDGPIPDDLVLTRYGRGADEVVITLGDARREVGSRAPTSSEGNFEINPELYNTLQENRYDPKLDYQNETLFLPKKDVVEIIERYAATLADRNAKARGIAVPAWAQKLIDKHGTDFPEAFGRRSDFSSPISRMVRWAESNGIDSKALLAITAGDKKPNDKSQALRDRLTDPAAAVEARREKEAERAGPAFGEIDPDPETAPASVVEAAAGYTDPSTGEVTPREGAATRKPERPYSKSRNPTEDNAKAIEEAFVELFVESKDGQATQEKPKKLTVRQVYDRAESAHRNQFWATGDLPSGINLYGPYATLGKIAAKGQPLQVVIAKNPGVEIPADVKKLIEAYQRRGFTIRTHDTVAVDAESLPYSERTTARVLGPTLDNPAHVVMVINKTPDKPTATKVGIGGKPSARMTSDQSYKEPPSARLARHIGIPVIDLSSPVQQKIAGDILRSYDAGRRSEIARSNAPAEVKAFNRAGEQRSGVQRSRDMLTAAMEKALASNWNNPALIERLQRVMALANRVDDEFFDAGLAARSPMSLANGIDALENYERQYNAEQGSVGNKATEQTAESNLGALLSLPHTSVRKLTSITNMFKEVFDIVVGDIVAAELDFSNSDSLASVSAKKGNPLTAKIFVDNILKSSKDATTTAFHEAAHVGLTLIQERYGKDVAKQIVDLADIPKVRKFIEDTYGAKDSVYYLTSPEELFVDAFANWAMGKLKLEAQSPLRRVFQAIADFFSVAVSQEQQLLEIFYAMRSGELKKLGVQNTEKLSDNLLARLNNSDHDFFSYGSGTPNYANIDRMISAMFGSEASVKVGDDDVTPDMMSELLYEIKDNNGSTVEARRFFSIASTISRLESLSPEERIASIVGFAIEANEDGGLSISSEHEEQGSVGKPSLSRPGTKRTATEEQFDNARDYIAKVLPPDVRVLVKKMSNMSGQYLERQLQDGDIDKIIELSSYANDPMSVAHHESMHALIASMRGQKEQSAFIKALLKAADSPLVISQLRALLKNEPRAREQMINDPEERIAYMYEFWAAGKLNLAPSVENWFVKLVRTIRGVLGVLDNNEKAGLYMAAFRDGAMREPSAVNNVVMETLSGPERALRVMPMARASQRFVRKVLETAHGRLKGYGNPALDKIADAFFADSTIGGQRSGYLQTVRDVVNMYGSQFNEIMRGSDAESMSVLAAALHSGVRPKDAAIAEQYDSVTGLMRRMHNYMKASGVPLNRVDGYFPQAWDKEAIMADPDGFRKMLVENARYRNEDGELVEFDDIGAGNTMRQMLDGRDKFDLKEDLAGFSPYMEAAQTRQIVLTDRKAAVEFMDHDIVRVVTRYITQAAKRGEYTRHFGHRGEKLKDWLDEAKTYGMDAETLAKDVAPAIQAMEGTLGHNINQYARDFMSGTITVMNLAILPLAVFSSLIDPMGIAVRGGTVEQAWDAFKAGIRNIPKSVRKDGGKLEIQELAELVGTVESQFTLDMLGDMYGSAYMSDWARKTNNLLFRYNLMEGWNTAMRSSATVAALDFIRRHAAGEHKDSARYLDELGLSKQDMLFGEDGQLLWSQADIAAELLRTGGDVSKALEMSRKTREAITRWVDGAVLRPHAAHRPAWASDPRWMLVWHLKQFTYSFQKTILERVIHEARNGNYNPALVLASYVPFMIAADFLRGMVQGAGEEPDWRKDMTFGETVWEGVQRAGLLGVRQFAVDGAENPAFALGPTANYMIDSAEKAADGRLDEALISALPGNALWKGW